MRRTRVVAPTLAESTTLRCITTVRRPRNANARWAESTARCRARTPFAPGVTHAHQSQPNAPTRTRGGAKPSAMREKHNPKGDDQDRHDDNKDEERNVDGLAVVHSASRLARQSLFPRRRFAEHGPQSMGRQGAGRAVGTRIGRTAQGRKAPVMVRQRWSVDSPMKAGGGPHHPGGSREYESYAPTRSRIGAFARLRLTSLRPG